MLILPSLVTSHGIVSKRGRAGDPRGRRPARHVGRRRGEIERGRESGPNSTGRGSERDAGWNSTSGVRRLSRSWPGE